MFTVEFYELKKNTITSTKDALMYFLCSKVTMA